MNNRIIYWGFLITAPFLAPGISRARWMNPDTGRFHTMDSYEGNQEEPMSMHKYLYCEVNPVNRIDPSGHAAYFIARELGFAAGAPAWKLGFGHGYLLFTSPSDLGTGDPFTTHQQIVDTFSWHPDVWDYKYEGDVGVPGRVWEHHPTDMNPSGNGVPSEAYLVTTAPSQQSKLYNSISSWIQAAKPGYEYGVPKRDPNDLNSEIGDNHVNAPKNGVYYSLGEQNCV